MINKNNPEDIIKKYPFYYEHKVKYFQDSSTKDVCFIPFEAEPTKGEHDYTKCKKCQDRLSEITEILKEDFKDFKLKYPLYAEKLEAKGVDISLNSTIPEMVAKKVIYTLQHIKNNQHSNNWYKLVTHYIDYIKISFGHVPSKEPLYFADYFFYVILLLEHDNEIKSQIKPVITEYLKALRYYDELENINPKVILSTYEKWLNMFPFELNSYFEGLKQHFENVLPILSNPEINIYTGIKKTKMHTKSSLNKVLENLTDDILKQIDGTILYEKGLISNADKTKLDLIFSKRQLKSKQKINDPQSNYQKVIDEWLKDEIEVIDGIIEFTKSETSKPPQKKESLSEFIIHDDKVEIAKKIKIRFKGLKGVDLRILLNALQELDLFPKGSNDSLFYRCCKNDFDWDIGTPQAMEPKVFKYGGITSQGERLKSDHELRLDETITFLKKIANIE